MRILAVTNLYPNPGQPERASFNRQQFRALATEHQVRVIAPIAWTSSAAARSVAPDRRRFDDGMEIEHPRFCFTPKVFRGWHGHFLRSSIRRAFTRAVAEFRPDVVLASWAYPDGWAAGQLAREAGIPVVVKVHGSDLHAVASGSVRERRTREALCMADAVIAVSDDLGRRCAAIGVDPVRIHTVRNGVDRDLFAPGDRATARRALGIAADGFLLLTVANLVSVKGIDLLIEALDQVKDGGVPIRSVIIGSGPLRRSLEQEAHRRHLPISFLGARSHATLPDWFRAANVVVLPSRAEGVPNVLLESSACGTPWIASAVGGIPEIAEAFGGPNDLVAPGDAQCLANAIVRAATGDRARDQELLPSQGPFIRSPVAASTSPLVPSWLESARALAVVLGDAAGLSMPGAVGGELSRPDRTTRVA
ncbi:MAG: glycosyltransferase [Phycisphaerae bacterium]|jgi:glycosyltransferase involved in cell wall biosynthesis|nr:glycosyltransferase [Phycisphaerae bacterium]